MKVPVWVEFSQEVEVEIGREEIVSAFSESPDHGETWFPVLNRFALCLNALSDDIIATWTSSQRRTIGDFLAKHALRFQETPASKIAAQEAPVEADPVTHRFEEIGANKIGWLGTSGTDMESHDY